MSRYRQTIFIEFARNNAIFSSSQYNISFYLKCAQELSNRILVLPLYEGLKSDIVQEIVGYIKNERKKSYI